MRIVQLVLGAVSLLAAACASVSPVASGPDIYVMRHLQKAAQGPDPALSEEGQANAVRLADWFGEDPPSAIYVSSTRRAQMTAAPLAAKLGVVPKTYNPSDTAALVQSVKAEPGTVLIVGHSNTVPDIIEQLGGARPADIADDRFGDIWRIRGPASTVTHSRLDD